MSARGLAGSAPRALLTVVIGNGAGGRRIGLEDGALLIVGSRRLVGGEVDEDSTSEVASTSMIPPADFPDSPALSSCWFDDWRSPDSSARALLAITLSIKVKCRVICRFSS